MAEQINIARTELLGEYNLRIRFSSINKDLVIDPQSIKELTITQDINSFVPSMRLTIPSAGEEYIHVVPMDRTLRVSIDFGFDVDSIGNSFDFLAYRRFPRGQDQLFDIEALLDVGDLFDKQHTRGFSGTVYDTIETIAKSLILQETIKESEQVEVRTVISRSLNYKKNLIQAKQTNAEFLSYLMDNIEGANGQSVYYCFLYNDKGRVTFLFQTLEEMLSASSAKYKFYYGKTAVIEQEETGKTDEYHQIWNYEIVDNYKLEGLQGSQLVNYTYFDYDTGGLVENSLSCADFFSLSNYFAIQRTDPKTSYTTSLGRNTEFSSAFVGKETSRYHRRLMNLVRIRVQTYGIPSARPGELVQLLFATPYDPEKQMDYQYQGLWMIESVQHSFGMQFLSSFILVRNGVNTGFNNNLVPATRGRSI